MMPEKANSCHVHKVSMMTQKVMLRKWRASLEGSRRVTLLEYSPGHNVGLVLNDRPQVSPNLIVPGGKSSAQTSAPEIEMFFIWHGYILPLWCKRHL